MECRVECIGNQGGMQFSLAGGREARHERCKRASAPQQPKVSTAKDMYDQPSSELLTSLEACFLCSKTWAGDPAVTCTCFIEDALID